MRAVFLDLSSLGPSDLDFTALQACADELVTYDHTNPQQVVQGSTECRDLGATTPAQAHTGGCDGHQQHRPSPSSKTKYQRAKLSGLRCRLSGAACLDVDAYLKYTFIGLS